MIIDFSQTVTNLDGKAIKMPGDEKGKEKVLELKTICINALLTELPDIKLSATDKIRHYELAKDINQAKELDLPAEDIVLLKDRISKVYTTLITGKSFELLERKLKEKK